MVKGKVVTTGLKKISKTKLARGAGIAAGAKIAEEAVDNPYAQAAIGAAEGAALGMALGPWGAAGGAVAGGLLGFVLADGERVIPVDMIAVPAYQYSAMLQGREPTFQLYIKEGEVVMPVMPTDAQLAGMKLIGQVETGVETVRKVTRTLSKWQRYMKVKKNQIKFKSGKRKGQLDLKRMGAAYRKGRKK